VLWRGAFAACLLTAADAANAGDRVGPADLWYSIKKQWCKEAQGVIRARRGRAGGGGSPPS